MAWGGRLAYFGLLVAITLGDLISFYIRQFESVAVVLGHLALLAAVVGYRDELRRETDVIRADPVPGSSSTVE